MTRAVFKVLALAVFLPSLSLAQTATATLSGTVSDESSAILPESTLRLINDDTALARTSTSDSDGGFSFSFVAPGRYTLHAERTGFAPAELKNVVLNVGDHVSVRVTLKIGSLTDAVSVVDAGRVGVGVMGRAV